MNTSYTYEEFQNSDSPYHVPLRNIASHLARETVDDAHDWVAQMMILYNTEAGHMLKTTGQGILRRHSAPDRERLALYKTHVPELEGHAHRPLFGTKQVACCIDGRTDTQLCNGQLLDQCHDERTVLQ